MGMDAEFQKFHEVSEIEKKIVIFQLLIITRARILYTCIFFYPSYIKFYFAYLLLV